MKKIVTRYFQNFSNKDLEKLGEMFSKDVKLQAQWPQKEEGSFSSLYLALS